MRFEDKRHRAKDESAKAQRVRLCNTPTTALIAPKRRQPQASCIVCGRRRWGCRRCVCIGSVHVELVVINRHFGLVVGGEAEALDDALDATGDLAALELGAVGRDS